MRERKRDRERERETEKNNRGTLKMCIIFADLQKRRFNLML